MLLRQKGRDLRWEPCQSFETCAFPATTLIFPTDNLTTTDVDKEYEREESEAADSLNGDSSAAGNIGHGANEARDMPPRRT